ncbi:longevity assurance proteins LAG1/LAC1 [Mycena latifolia]|nr:longevity assurance proteins LAG1/LAC1 [Mycena latifolia]
MSRARKRSGQFVVRTKSPPRASDPAYHIADPFQPQTPLGSSTPERTPSPSGPRRPRISPWLRWAVEPAEAFKLLLVPIVLYTTWELLTPYLSPVLEPLASAIPPYILTSNPFGPIFLISHRAPTSDPNDSRYEKGWCDFLFLAYNIVFFACLRQLLTVNLFRRLARYFGLKKQTKLDRFGEQGYAVVYFLLSGAWGLRIMAQLPTWWYQTEYFWINYPHWAMTPELKRYYLMQMAYWCHQLIVLLLRLEKPRKDYHELVAHHAVTLWMVGWSYMINLTLIGNAVYMSMDIPDMFFACQYFRHYLSLVILCSVWTEFRLDSPSRHWKPADGAYLPGWMRYQIFVPLALLQALNLFWYFLILRIVVRTIKTSQTDDDRSDDEGGDDDEDLAEKSAEEASAIRGPRTPTPTSTT